MKKYIDYKNKILVVIILFFFSISLTGCSIKETETYSTFIARKEAESYFEYLKEKDIYNLNKLLSENAQKTHNLESEWEEFFDFIDGNVVSYRNLMVASQTLWVDEWKTTKLIFVVHFYDVETDTGKIYKELGWEKVSIDVNNREKEGINNIYVRFDNGDSYQYVSVGVDKNL